MWTNEKIEKKLEYLRSQKENSTGNYRKYLVNIYSFILEDSKKDNKGWSKANTREMLSYIYENKSDHMGYELINEWKKELKEMGYIKFVKENDEWHTYIVKEIDF
ncbi:MAG: hypothetical protein K0S47_4044 [Herbinix sp.]|jgi:hypothetical protein|nr:hypothetical protein [Herbinix sp.]